MRYHFEKKPEFYASQYERIYICDHSVYSRCTLYELIKKLGSYSAALRPGGAR